MQNKIMILFMALLLGISTSGSGFAKTLSASDSGMGTGYNSVEWQAVKLQEGIENKIKRSLRPVIAEDEYVIEVKVGLDLGKAEDPTSKKIIKSVQKKKVQFSNVAFPKNGDDFIVFNKLGLEAPIIGEEPVESQVSEAELNQKAAIELNDRYNLFNFLETVTINVTFDQGLSEKNRSNIKAILDGLSFYTKDAIPQFNIQFVDLKEPVVPDVKKDDKAKLDIQKEVAPPKKPVVEKEQIIQERRPDPTVEEDRFKNLDIMIGLIVGAVVIGLAGMFIAKQVFKHEEKIESNNVNTNTDESKVTEESVAEIEETLEEDYKDETGEEEMIDLTASDAQTVKINQGLERFRTVMQHHKSDAILLIKEWVKANETQENAALKALVQVLTDNELADIFKLMTADERSSWKSVLDGEMTKEEIAKAFVFISNGIIKKMMVPSLIDDYEVCDLLLSLSAEEAVKYCTQYPDLGVVFTNVLSAKVISEMFKILPQNIAMDIIERSTYFKREEILNQMPLLKSLLMKTKEGKEKPPFLKRIIEILPTAKADIERKLYATLLSHLSVEETSQIALSVLPSQIIDRLPGDVFAGVMGALSHDDQLNYLATLSANARETQLERFAPEGTKAREMIELELSEILDNEIHMRRLGGERKNEIMQNFLRVAREFLAKNPKAKKEVLPVTKDWLESIRAEVVPAKKSSAA